MFDKSSVIYEYDGSFDGFLSCVFESFLKKEMPADICPPSQTQLSLLPRRNIPTSAERARSVSVSLPRRISKEGEHFLYLSFLTCLEQKELHMLRFIRLGFQHGAAVLNFLANDTVSNLFKAVQFLKHEAHLFTGFIRFSDCNHVLCSVIHPKNYSLPLLRTHFRNRLPGEAFLIYDATHHMTLLHRPGQDAILPDTEFSMDAPDQAERHFRKLWRSYYHTIAVEGRENEVCRRSHMPKRYWADMTEFQEDAPEELPQPPSQIPLPKQTLQ